MSFELDLDNKSAYVDLEDGDVDVSLDYTDENDFSLEFKGVNSKVFLTLGSLNQSILSKIKKEIDALICPKVKPTKDISDLREKYKELEAKKLSSGIPSNIYYNFRKLTSIDKLRIQSRLREELVCGPFILVGVKTMGWEIVKDLNDIAHTVCYDPKTDTLSNDRVFESYAIFDDVYTTGGTIRKAIQKIGFLPQKVFSLVNRLNIIELTKELTEGS